MNVVFYKREVRAPNASEEVLPRTFVKGRTLASCIWCFLFLVRLSDFGIQLFVSFLLLDADKNCLVSELDCRGSEAANALYEESTSEVRPETKGISVFIMTVLVTVSSTGRGQR